VWVHILKTNLSEIIEPQIRGQECPSGDTSGPLSGAQVFKKISIGAFVVLHQVEER